MKCKEFISREPCAATLCDLKRFLFKSVHQQSRIRVNRPLLILTGEQCEKSLINEACLQLGSEIFVPPLVNRPCLITVDSCNSRTNSRWKGVHAPTVADVLEISCSESRTCSSIRNYPDTYFIVTRNLDPDGDAAISNYLPGNYINYVVDN